ncbi:dolichol-P-Man dependent alpha(1-3) mannosyltransferase Alg3 [Schizosaccharomyces cryophilus OY26]|uniref:Dol-P-Man:Man(5)GlcNAc(2)-PP-Dol alpha-1,3-mannosyltransferase n=1 Tax=Schizosaccharomyces cryophilus (strain OY26 / ATCC MYA-4695 / CBS 11777 / NBRC 106824 / NRRL Y48691) TaxID=653667 RepID=S9XFL7_SCHCR|nr:dolichol-P-Man dependent alpha(1-3) mannosyltransferase Alg3 [Schizosaccharomyces cryophilus OY26]EPY52431.1 dolichol-P-Man dependent alpha(1-3) mannosyltransferase Alg3 [Schizosaccharomyces cryophilus OY26]
MLVPSPIRTGLNRFDPILLILRFLSSRWFQPNRILWLEIPFVILIISNVPYTEIDWIAYMEQISGFLSGERDYRMLYGSTGPLVYPGGHVLLYTLLYFMTDRGTNITKAQYIFAFVYWSASFVVGCIFRTVHAPLYLYGLLILSKRLHSIFILRLFNDSFNSLFASLFIFFACKKKWKVSSIFLSIACSIKMSSLLFLPAYLVVLLQAVGPKKTWLNIFTFLFVQALFSVPFSGFFWSYLSQAFDFGRVFDYKWTVNWRFLPKSIFYSPLFSLTVLSFHVLLLTTFAIKKWNYPSKASPLQMVRSMLTLQPLPSVAPISVNFILTTLTTSNLIGILCARSLHYQFYAWFAWYVPYMLYQAKLSMLQTLLLWGLQEYAWNVFPSTTISSITAVSIPAIIIYRLLTRNPKRP